MRRTILLQQCEKGETPRLVSTKGRNFACKVKKSTWTSDKTAYGLWFNLCFNRMINIPWREGCICHPQLEHGSSAMRGVSPWLSQQANIQICHQPRAELPCHDGHPGCATLSAECTLLPLRLTPIFSWHAVTACYKPGYVISVAKMEVEETVEDKCGVSWEASTQTSAAVAQPLLLLAPLLPSHCQAASCFSAGPQSSDVPLNNSKSQQGQTDSPREGGGGRGMKRGIIPDNRRWGEI